MKNEFHDRRNRRGGFKGGLLITLVLVLSMIISVPFFSNAAGEGSDGSTANTASGKFDPDQDRSLIVKANSPEGEFDDLLDMDLAIDLYLLVPAIANDGSDGYTFDWEKSPYKDALEEDYKSLNGTSSEELEDALGNLDAVTDLTGDALHELSQKAAVLVLNADTGAERVEKTNTGSGKIRDTGIITGITIKDLDAGLYLLVVRNKDADSGYVTTRMEEDGKTENIVTIASSTTNSYTFLPQLVSLPKKGEIIGSTNTADKANWNYNVEIYLKPEKGNGSLIIEKTLKSYYDNFKRTTFVFHVVATSPDGKITYYDDYVSIDFDGPGTKSEEINDIPIGAVVTVEEVYDGSSYRLVGDKPFPKTISGSKESYIFAFENEYDWTQTGGHGINNHFTYKSNSDNVNSDDVNGTNDHATYNGSSNDVIGGWEWEDPTKAGSGSQDN